MLLTDNYITAFEFVKVIIQNTVYNSENGTVHDVIMYGEVFSNILAKWSIRMILAKTYENIFNFVKVIHRIL